MDRAHAEEASGWYHETSLVLEPPREREKTQAEKRLGLILLWTRLLYLPGLTLRTVLHNMLSSPQV